MRIHKVCNCGCTKLKVPYHLRNEELRVQVDLRKDIPMESVRFTIEYETKPDDKGWKEQTTIGKEETTTNQGGESTLSR